MLGRILKNLIYPDWLARRAFPSRVFAAIERAIADSEVRHGGEIRFVVQASLDIRALWRHQTARERAVDVFSQLRVWDTEDNNGVLIFLLMAERDVEIVADRGIARQVPGEEWERICRAMEEHFRAGRFQEGVLGGIREISRHLEAHAPRRRDDINELPDRPLRV